MSSTMRTIGPVPTAYHLRRPEGSEAVMGRVLSGIQPTGDVHIGNYIGALQHWVKDQELNDSFYCLVDLHAITLTPPAPDVLRDKTLEAAAILLAVGIDPQKATLFVQSHVPEHTQLAWVLNCFTAY